MQLVYVFGDTLCHSDCYEAYDLEIAALANKAEVANGQANGH